MLKNGSNPAITASSYMSQQAKNAKRAFFTVFFIKYIFITAPRFKSQFAEYQKLKNCTGRERLKCRSVNLCLFRNFGGTTLGRSLHNYTHKVSLGRQLLLHFTSTIFPSYCTHRSRCKIQSFRSRRPPHSRNTCLRPLYCI